MRRIDRKCGLKRLMLLGVALGFAALSVSADSSNRRMSADDPCLTRFGFPQAKRSAGTIQDRERGRRFYPASHAGARMTDESDRDRYFHAAILFRDLDELPSVDDRKVTFISIVLPMILRVNEGILGQRRLVEAVVACRDRGQLPGPALQTRIQGFHDRYGTDGDLDALLRRMDVVPPSLAIAQAAIESGWGTSRFVVLGNALFGQRTTNPARGMRPANLSDTTPVRVAAFDHLVASVNSYVHNLNTHPAYRTFRDRRIAFRRSGGEPDGLALAATLAAYSARGQGYVRDLQSIIRANRLAAFDTPAPAAMPGVRMSGSDT